MRPVKSYEEELLDLIARQSRRVPAFVFGVLIIIASLMYPHSPLGVVVWMGFVVAVLATRYWILPQLPDRHDLSLQGRLNVAAALSGINGLAHASSLLVFPLLSDIERSIQSLVLAGLCTAAVGTTAGNRRVFLPYLLAIFPALVLLWATDGSWSWPTLNNAGIALSVGMFAVVVLMVARDTERQFLETIRIRKEQEAINIQLQKALQDAGVADRAKTRFLASASHDLRQPIHALSLFAAALKMQTLPDDARALADNIDESISVLASQLDALLDISKLDAGVIAPELSPVDLTNMLRRIAREFEVEVTEKGLDLVVDVDDDCHVQTDKLLLERVIRNLLNNAVRYTEQGAICIECHPSEGGCRLAIVDSGIGIPAPEQHKIFSEFYQVSERTESAQQGLGLGLSIVTRLLALLETPLSLTSAPGEGTRIELSLQGEQGSEEIRDIEAMKRLEGIRVLVIDDDRAVRSAMSALLAGVGAKVSGAASIDRGAWRASMTGCRTW
ncbi:MAG: HAMP domain-containing sensor histidine kinase [Gammaproteobacteria bacterium]|nr:HAMP domain-containing sensor histidine kinase [Gammaproteobacteria bacterium]